MQNPFVCLIFNPTDPFLHFALYAYPQIFKITKICFHIGLYYNLSFTLPCFLLYFVKRPIQISNEISWDFIRTNAEISSEDITGNYCNARMVMRFKKQGAISKCTKDIRKQRMH
jgi:hypothetical protein